MSRVKAPKLRWFFTAGALVLLAFFVYGLRGVLYPYHYDPGSASTSQDVTELTGTLPPSEARDIRVASYMCGQGWADFVRFSAPTDVCVKYAEQLSHRKLEPLKDDDLWEDIGLLNYNTPEFKDLSWFDLPDAKDYWAKMNGKVIFKKPSPYADLKVPREVMAADYPSEEANLIIITSRWMCHAVCFIFTITTDVLVLPPCHPGSKSDNTPPYGIRLALP